MGKARSHNGRPFFERYSHYLRYGTAVGDIITVPPMAFSFMGVISFTPTFRPIIAVPGIIDVISTVLLLVAGYYVPKTPGMACPTCNVGMHAEIRVWTCETCGYQLKPGKKRA